MSATEWSPGDVITDEGGCVFFVIEDADSRRAIDADGNDWYLSTIEAARRLVVLDPESDEDVQRLHDAVMYVVDESVRTRDNLTYASTQAALRELANPTPPKPDEPKGLGAVVEDRDGDRWVRVNTSTGTAEWRSTNYLGQTARWTQIPAVRVLSEGVSD